MKLRLEQHIAAPTVQVFDAVSDLDRLVADLGGERVAFDATDPGDGAGEGAHWRVSLHLRGLERVGDVRVAQFTPGESYVLYGEIEGVHAVATVVVSPLPESHSQLAVTLEFSARSLRGRVLLGSLFLLEGPLRHRLETHLRTLAARIEGTA